MRISDWSSDVCSSDLQVFRAGIRTRTADRFPGHGVRPPAALATLAADRARHDGIWQWPVGFPDTGCACLYGSRPRRRYGVAVITAPGRPTDARARVFAGSDRTDPEWKRTPLNP